jgi:hypothetical protein
MIFNGFEPFYPVHLVNPVKNRFHSRVLCLKLEPQTHLNFDAGSFAGAGMKVKIAADIFHSFFHVF